MALDNHWVIPVHTAGWLEINKMASSTGLDSANQAKAPSSVKIDKTLINYHKYIY